ncbi:hypothetical protein TSOC_007861, partial [Tetrabaena socialis]
MESDAAHQLQQACSPAAPPLQQLQAGVALSPDDPSRIWLPEIVQLFTALLSPNEVAGTLRLVNKATAVQLRGPQHTTMRLSQPVPRHAFVWRWSGPGAMRCLAAKDRRALPQLTACSGSIANLEVLLARDDLGLEGETMQVLVLESAAQAGQLDVCAWLWQRGWPLEKSLLDAAARGGQQEMYEWLLANGCPKGNEMKAATQAAWQGHAGMMDWLLLGTSASEETSLVEPATLLGRLHHTYLDWRSGGGDLDDLEDLMHAVAAGCDLPTLQRLHHAYLDSLSGDMEELRQHFRFMYYAAKSHTADWQAKLEWLEARGYPLTEDACWQAAGMPDALPRLQWLRQLGFPFSQQVARNAAGGGNMEELQYVLGQGGVNYDDEGLMASAAWGGNVAIMEVLHARGVRVGRDMAAKAAGRGHLLAVAWLVERLGAGTALTADVFQRAAKAGSMALMMWLRELGCPWNKEAFAKAARHGSEEQLEWLAEQGCPMGDNGLPYVEAVGVEGLVNLRCLRRLGCPWSPDGGTFTSVLHTLGYRREDQRKRALCWLLDQGCPVDWDQEPQPASSPSPDPSSIWLPEIVQRFADSLPPNEVPFGLRLVNKAAAAQFRGPQHSTMRLSQPVPHHAFVWRWAGPGAMRRLTARDRRALPQLTACSGSIANLEVLLARDDLSLDPRNKRDSLFESAAEVGQLDVCVWLRQRGSPVGMYLLDAAAIGGQQAVYEWLLANGCPKGDEVEAAHLAGTEGHVGMMDWLLLGATAPEETSLDESATLLRAAAASCDLPTLQRLHHTYLDRLGRELPDALRQGVVANAARCPTADWRAKVEWLEARGYPQDVRACWQAAAKPDALPRLQWLRQRGYPFSQEVAHSAAGGGNMEALQYVLVQGGVNYADGGLMDSAAQGGHVAIMEVLHARGVPAGSRAIERAVGGGHLPAVAWLVERLGADTALTVGVFKDAVEAGSMALMVWLRERGCPWDAAVFAAAARHGSEEQLEWLAEQGCPMGDNGLPYGEAVCAGDLAILRCLRRLGCPWRTDGSTFTSILKWLNYDLEDHVKCALCWLLDQGCPVDWDQVEATAAEGQRIDKQLEWLRRQRQERASPGALE